VSDRLQDQRLEYTGDLHSVLQSVAHDFGFGELESYDIVDIGYEDFNVIIQTDGQKHFVKIFSKVRRADEIQRYVEVVKAVLTAGVRHPELHEYQGNPIYTESTSGLKMAVMQFVEGKTFYQDGKRTPLDEELKQVLAQAVLIAKTPLKPVLLEDSWAIQNTGKWYEEIKDKLADTDRTLIEQALEDFQHTNYEQLPHCLVHGDLIKSNLIVGADNKIFVLDFSVANWYPRVQELAVIGANLMNDGGALVDFETLVQKIISMYQEQGGELTQEEIDALPGVTRLAYAAELVGSLKEEILNGNETDENKYWLQMGRIGLQKSRVKKL